MKLSILGTEYETTSKKFTDDSYFEAHGCNVYCDKLGKQPLRLRGRRRINAEATGCKLSLPQPADILDVGLYIWDERAFRMGDFVLQWMQAKGGRRFS